MLRIMATTFTIKEGATAPALEVTLKDSSGDALDISGNLGVQFIMRERQHASNEDPDKRKVDAAATVVDAAGGIVKYSWVAADTDEVEDYVGEFVVTGSDTKPRKVPTPAFITIRVVEAL